MSLYHYTDAHGLMGIIQRRALWATDVGFLNDSKEIFAGIDLIKRRCDEILVRLAGSDSHILKAATELYKHMPDFALQNLTRRNIYVVSFSEAHDNLRQWMSYCPQNAGYAIEFDRDRVLMLGEVEIENRVVCRLEKVDYHEEELDKIIAPEFIIEAFKKAGGNIEQAALKTINNLIFHCCAIKSHEFYDERETRLIIQSQLEKNNPVSFRSRAGLIIPYFEYTIERSWIKEITIGPNINMPLARKGLENFLAAHGMDCTIRESACSLRVF